MFTPCMFLCGLEVINMCVYARTNIVSQWAPIFSNSNWCLLFLGGGWDHGFKTHWVKLYIYIYKKKSGPFKNVEVTLSLGCYLFIFVFWVIFSMIHKDRD